MFSLQQCLPLAVLKLCFPFLLWILGIQLQQCLPLAVLKLSVQRTRGVIIRQLQQCLPLAVLKPAITTSLAFTFTCCNSAYRLRYWNHQLRNYLCFHYQMVATVPTACGIETLHYCHRRNHRLFLVATVPTACGIETRIHLLHQITVLHVATVPTACGIETSWMVNCKVAIITSCNSAYRLRYWNEPPTLENAAFVSCNSAYRLRYWNYTPPFSWMISPISMALQQCLPLAVLKLKFCV